MLLLFYSCEEKTPSPQTGEQTVAEETAEEAKRQPVQAVCIYDGLYFRSGPSAAEGAVARLKRGEIVTWLGNAVVDAQDERKWEFYDLRLTDGSVGWALSYYIVPEAEPAAVVSRTSIYEKNNLISKTEDSVEPLDIIAVIEEQDDWMKVVRNDKSKEFWLKPGHITKAEVDIAVANQTLNALGVAALEERLEKLQAILEDDVFTDSIFIPMIDSFVQEIQNELNPVEEQPGRVTEGSSSGMDT